MNARSRCAGFLTTILLTLTLGSHCFAQPGDYPDSMYCGSMSSSRTQVGGASIPSFGTVHALVVFIDFPDDTVDVSNAVWPVGDGPSYLNTFIDPDTSLRSGEHFNITTYYEQMSFNNLHVVGDAYYIQARHPLAWYAADTTLNESIPYWAMRHVLEYMDTAAEYNINFTLFDEWQTTAPYTHVSTPNDTVEMVMCAWRRRYRISPNSTGGFGDIGWSSLGVIGGVGPAFPVDEGLKTITAGSGLHCLDMMNYPSCFETPLHEFGHYLGLPHQYDGGVWSVMGQRNSNNGYYCMNSYEREQMGWITIDDVTAADTIMEIPDFATTGVAYRISLPGGRTHFLLENHQGINEYDVVDAISGSRGLYILRQTKEQFVDRLEVMNADGRWKWLNVGHAQSPWSTDTNAKIPVFQRDVVQRDTGRTDRQRVRFTDPRNGFDFQYKWLDPRSGDSAIGAPKAGDGKDMWNTTVANMFSPWSNPSSVADTSDTAGSHVAVHVIDSNGSYVYAKIYTSHPEQGPPSRPQDFRVWAHISGSTMHPELSWEPNIEPDLIEGGGYEIWRRVEPYQVGSGPWVLIDSTDGITHGYVDSGIDSVDTVYAVHSVSYKIRAFDSTGKRSTFSEIRGIYVRGGSQYGGGGGLPSDGPCCLGSGKVIARRQDGETAGEVTLWPNRPNPFGGTTEIAYSLTRAGRVIVDVFDPNGKRVAVLVDDVEQGAGTYRVTFDARELPAGVYICRVIAGGMAVAEPITLTR